MSSKQKSQQQPQSKKGNKDKKSSSLLPLIMFPIMMATIFYVTKQVSIHAPEHIRTFYQEIENQPWNEDTKVHFLIKTSFYLSLFVLVCVIITANSRFLSGIVNPIQNPDPLFFATMNRILSNTCEGYLIFIPLLAYYTMYQSTEQTRNLTLTIGILYVFGRVLFGVGYLFGSLIGKPTLRGAGFAINMNIMVGLALTIFGFSPYDRF